VATDEDEAAWLPETDHRQDTYLAAGWTLGSFRQLALAGAASLSYYEAVGPRGILSRKGKTYEASPLFHLFKELSSGSGSKIITTHSSHPLEFDAICLKDKQVYKVLISNFDKSALTIKLEGIEREVDSLFKLGKQGWESQNKNDIIEHRINMESGALYLVLYSL